MGAGDFLRQRWAEILVGAATIGLAGFVAWHAHTNRTFSKSTEESNSIEEIVEVEAVTPKHHLPHRYSFNTPAESYHDLEEGDPVRNYLETTVCELVNKFDEGFDLIMHNFQFYNDDYMPSSVLREVAHAWSDMLKLEKFHGTDPNLELCGDYEQRMWHGIDDVYKIVGDMYDLGNDDGYVALLLAEARYDNDRMEDAKIFLADCEGQECANYQDAFAKEFGEPFAEAVVEDTYYYDGIASAHEVADDFGMGYLAADFYAGDEQFFDAASASCPTTNEFSIIGGVSLFYEDISIPFQPKWVAEGCQFSLDCLSSRFLSGSNTDVPYWEANPF